MSRLNKKENVEVDSPASSGDEENSVKYVSFLWPPPEAALSIFDVKLCLKTFFEKGLMIRKETAISAEPHAF